MHLSFYGFCIEKTQTVDLYGSYFYTVNPGVVGSPLGGSDTGAITQEVALKIQGLVDQHWSVALSSNVNAAAFQLALWEIEYDGAYTTNYFATGRILASVVPGSADGQAALTQAAQWLDSLHPASAITSVVALNSAALDIPPNHQDLIVVVPVPLPPAIGTGLAMLGGLFAVRKLRRRAAAE
jgi:hypothetical protein